METRSSIYLKAVCAMMDVVTFAVDLSANLAQNGEEHIKGNTACDKEKLERVLIVLAGIQDMRDTAITSLGMIQTESEAKMAHLPMENGCKQSSDVISRFITNLHKTAN